MFSNQKGAQKPDSLPASENGQPAAPAISLLSVVGERARMEGKFDIADSIQVECEVGGEMNVGGKLVIGEKGVVNATIRAGVVLVSGQVSGNLEATERVHLSGKARVFGDIESPVLVIEEGVLFEGNCRMIKGRPADPPQPSTRDLSVVSLKR